jgi:hypothetical protein
VLVTAWSVLRPFPFRSAALEPSGPAHRRTCMQRSVAWFSLLLVVGACSSTASSSGASHTPTTRTCSGNAQNVDAPKLAEADGIGSFPTMTKISSGTAPLSSAKDGFVAKLDCTFTPSGSLSQFWLMSSAIAQYGGADKVPLPIPISFASKHSGPTEVNVTVLAFTGSDQPRALLHNPDFATNPGWSNVDTPIRGGNTLRVDSLANDGSQEYIVQFANGDRWVDVSILGAHLTIRDVQYVAGLVGTT